MTEATKSLSELFSQRDFQESVKAAASGIGKVAKGLLNVAMFDVRYRVIIADVAALIGKLWAVDKIVNFTLKRRFIPHFYKWGHSRPFRVKRLIFYAIRSAWSGLLF